MASEDSTLSWFLRHSGDVLRTLDKGDVRLTRRDGPNLVLTTGPRAEAMRDGLATLARIILEAASDLAAAPSLSRWVSRAVPGASYLTSAERVRLLTDVAESAAAAAGLGTSVPLAFALERWRRTARSRAVSPPQSAHLSRPVAIPDDVDDPSIEKASGVIELPLHVRWSHPARSYDLGNPRQRRLVYEQVLSEGLEDDVRRFIDVDILVADWHELVLPPRVRRAWAEWMHRRRALDLAC